MLPKIRYCEMSLSHNYFDWIDLNDQNQCEWAKRYLVKSRFSIDGHMPLITQIESISRYFNAQYSSHEYATLIMRKMQAAWNQKENRSKNKGRKAYSFVMDTKIAAKLKEISGDYPLYQTLEYLIEQGSVLNKNEAILLEIEEQQKKLDSTSEKADQLLRASEKRLNAQLISQKEIVKSQFKILKSLLLKNCTNEILIERHALTDKLLSDDEQKLALKKTDEQFEFYEKTIKAEVEISKLHIPFEFKKKN